MTEPHQRTGPSSYPEKDDTPPGVPGFLTWGRVYATVFALFVVCVVLLAVFARLYS